MHIQQITAALASHGDRRAIVLNDGTLKTSDARAFFGYRFRTVGAKERHRRTIEAFIDAVRAEHGESAAALTQQLLAQHRTEGRPLRKYIVQDMLHILDGERRNIVAHNNRFIDMEFLTTHFTARPETAALPPGLVALAAGRTCDIFTLLWKDAKEPLPPTLFRQITQNVSAQVCTMNEAEHLLNALEADDGKGVWTAPLRRLQDEYGLSDQNMETVRRYMHYSLPLCALRMSEATSAGELLEQVETHRLPGLQTLLVALSPMPPEQEDSQSDAYPLSPMQRAWIDLLLPEPGISRTLALQHAADIFARIPAEGPPLPSEIWFSIFNEQRPSLDVFPEQLDSRIRERLLHKMEEDAVQAEMRRAAAFDAPDGARIDHLPETGGLDDETALRLCDIGLKYQSALRIAMGDADVRPEDYIRPLLPFSPRRLPVLRAEARQRLEHTLGNHLTASAITFHMPQGMVDIVVHGARTDENHEGGPMQASIRWAEQLCATPVQRDCLVLLLSELGTRCLRELSSLCGCPLHEHTGSQAAASVEGDAVLLQQSLNVLHVMSKSRVTAGVTYRIQSDGVYTIGDVFLRRTPLHEPGREMLRAYLEATLYSEPFLNEQQQGGLPGTLEMLLETWRVDRANLPLLARFIAQSLGEDFADPPADLTGRRLHEHVMHRNLRGLNELLYALGTPIPAGPLFSQAAVLDSYPSVDPLDKALLFRLAGPGIPYVLGLQSLKKIKLAAADTSPFTVDAYWRGVFGAPPPADTTAITLAKAAEQRLDEIFTERLDGAPETVFLTDGHGMSRSMLKDIFILSGVRMETALDRAVTHQGLDTKDFAALPVLRSLNALPPEHVCLEQLAQDLPRMGEDEEPSITFHDPLLGERILHPQHSFAMSPEEWENLRNAGLNNPIMLGVIRHAANICGPHAAQRRALYIALGQVGRLPFRHLCHAAHPEHVLHEHAGCSIVVRQRPDGLLSVNIDTLKHSPITGHIGWLISPDGLGRCEELRLHPAENRGAGRHVRFTLPDASLE